ncbi:DUF3261 domain-containing protein [Ectopseudomonas mendocina]|uniref:DUF3261 domain-containing protein n=1 Tax=Ectopseudomonas mendocina TaxID=300 RepID=A0ABZ2RFB4_ECTME
MLRALLLSLSLLLSACASHTALPERQTALVAELPLTLQVQRQTTADQQDWLLVLQDENGSLRASLFDPIGVPLARQQLRDGSWHNDGLLPPNYEARELFSALLFALTPADQLNAAYPSDNWQVQATGSRQLAPQWRIDYRTPLDFTLYQPADLRYQISPLPDDKAP